MDDVRIGVEKGKFELAVELNRITEHTYRGDASFGRLPEGYHGVNSFYVLETKGRRRLITEPILNGVVEKESIPKVSYPSRLEKRQLLKHCRYMLQIDFNSYYDAIPLEDSVRNNFVFRGKDGQYYRLRTLPTGARWSVCVGQAITSTIVDIDVSQVVILSLIDNILIAAPQGSEGGFCLPFEAF
ncbi:hypothetical protein ADEAN_000973800 [Angomonas deanei]|uniref:Reverse transcriptase domain-containing protein n=1 Tax=Angomonas deanei TaxID=59799 RepID=A0A7G2CQV7_9TRYP|nr:hypothetical protein ADEAN_000973800 [Angomonas deanei]